MPNPDGTHTRDEHRAAILQRAKAYVEAGVPLDDAIAKAGAEHRDWLRAEGDRKIAGVLKFLGVKPH